MNMKIILSTLVFFLILFSCNKERNNSNSNSNNSNKYIDVKIGGVTKTGGGMFPSLPFDERNYFTLNDKKIGFSGVDCFHYGGYISFENGMQSIDAIYGNDGCIGGFSYQIDNDNETYSNVKITRNDNKIGGIIEGSISGKCKKYIDSGYDDYRLYDFSVSFKVLIVE